MPEIFANIPGSVLILIGVGALALFLIVGILIGISIRKKFAEGKIGSAEAQAKKIVEEGTKAAETKKKEALIEAKEEILRQRNDVERELKERRAEVTRMERRLTQKEENIDKKSDALERKNELLEKKIKEADAVREQVNLVLSQHLRRLEEISGISSEDAKRELMNRVERLVRVALGLERGDYPARAVALFYKPLCKPYRILRLVDVALP